MHTLLIKKIVRNTTLFTLILLLLFPCITAYSSTTAELPSAVTKSCESVLQLILSCTDTNGNTYYINHGTGFVVGADEEKQYIITSYNTVTATAEQLSQIRKWGGLASDEALTTQISIMLEPDILISANIISTGSSLPYALLTPEQPLNQISAVKFNFCKNITRGQNVFSYGYDAEQLLLGQITPPSVIATYKNGTITNISLDPLAVSSDITAESGFAGAPILDMNGYVIGMFFSKNGNMEIIPSDAIINVLETLNITHSTNTPTSDYNIADDSIKDELSLLLAECQQDVMKNGTKYSKKTLSAYKTAITNAIEVSSNNDSTKDDYQNSIDALNKARKDLKPYNYIHRVIQLILAIILLFLLFINIRQYLKSLTLYRTLHPQEALINKEKRTAALIRVDTNEVIWITQKKLRIGSDPNMVDYTITNNPAISHYHAAILQKGAQYYLIDNHSTNHTTINHTVLTAEKPYLLHENDTVFLANETFTFHFIKD